MVVPNYRYENCDRMFCKIVSGATAKIILTDGTIRWSTPETLNDPYDLQFDLHIDVDREAVKAAAIENMWEDVYGDEAQTKNDNFLGSWINMLRGHFPQLSKVEFRREFSEAIDEGFAGVDLAFPKIKEDVRSLMRNSKLLCLTESEDNSPLWTHYGDMHRGVCLRFKTPKGFDSPWLLARPINYVGSMPRLFDQKFLTELISGRTSLNVEDIMDRMIFTKSKDWAYEREWRIFAGNGRNKDAPYEDLPFHSEELDAIIFGCRMPLADQEALIAIAKTKFANVNMFRMRKDDAEFWLIADPI